MWEIVDDNGVIYSGSEDEMMMYWQQMNSEDNYDEWEGDLKLIEVHAATR